MLNFCCCGHQELELAEQVLENLTSIIQEATTPAHVASIPALRRAMGVNLIPAPLPAIPATSNVTAAEPPAGGGTGTMRAVDVTVIME